MATLVRRLAYGVAQEERRPAACTTIISARFGCRCQVAVADTPAVTSRSGGPMRKAFMLFHAIIGQ